LFEIGGVDGTRTRDLRHDRRKGVGARVNDFLRFLNEIRRQTPTRDDTEGPVSTPVLTHVLHSADLRL
jgi:hypothetical protein